MALEPPAVPTSGFFADELGRALAECGFGILSWEVDAVASGAGSGELGVAQATAKVCLIPNEDKQPETVLCKTVQKNIGVRLTIAGYQVSPVRVAGKWGDGWSDLSFTHAESAAVADSLETSSLPSMLIRPNRSLRRKWSTSERAPSRRRQRHRATSRRSMICLWKSAPCLPTDGPSCSSASSRISPVARTAGRRLRTTLPRLRHRTPSCYLRPNPRKAGHCGRGLRPLQPSCTPPARYRYVEISTAGSA